MKKIVAVVGSPHLEGNTNAMVDLAIQTAKAFSVEITKISLGETPVKPCIACGLCKKQLTCSIQDDQMIHFFELLKNADGIIFASPTYMGGISAQLKAFLDRTVALRRNNFLLKNKFGCAFAVGGSRNGGQEFVISQIQNVMHIQGMLPVGDDNHFGGIAHAPFQADQIGQETVIQATQKLCRLLTA